MTPDINDHLSDIVADVNHIRKAVNAAADGEGPESKLTEDQVKSRLCDISNALDDLYNAVVGI